MVDTKKRTFEVESSDINVKGGTYKSMTPDAAARKAGSRLFKKAESTSKSSKKEIVFTIKEKTRGSEKKTFKYSAKRVKLAKPTILKIKGKEIVYRYKTVVKALK